MSFLTELWESIFVPGVSPTLVKATHITFIFLTLLLICLLMATKSIHLGAMLLLSTGLWISVTWFVYELSKSKTEPETDKEKKDKDSKSIIGKSEKKIEKEQNQENNSVPSQKSTNSSSTPLTPIKASETKTPIKLNTQPSVTSGAFSSGIDKKSKNSIDAADLSKRSRDQISKPISNGTINSDIKNINSKIDSLQKTNNISENLNSISSSEKNKLTPKKDPFSTNKETNIKKTVDPIINQTPEKLKENAKNILNNKNNHLNINDIQRKSSYSSFASSPASSKAGSVNSSFTSPSPSPNGKSSSRAHKTKSMII